MHIYLKIVSGSQITGGLKMVRAHDAKAETRKEKINDNVRKTSRASRFKICERGCRNVEKIRKDGADKTTQTI